MSKKDDQARDDSSSLLPLSNNVAAAGEKEQVIRVLVEGTEWASFTHNLKVSRSTTGADAQLRLGKRLNLPAAELINYSLVVMRPQSSERLRQNQSPREGDPPMRWILHTLRPEELVLSQGLGTEPGEGQGAARWYFRDSRAAPMEVEFGEEVSGESSGDEGESQLHLPAQVASSLGQGECSGFLFVRSEHDPNLWRKRWGILKEYRLWLIQGKVENGTRQRRRKVRCRSVALAGVSVTEATRPEMGKFAIELQTAHSVLCLRCESKAKQALWQSFLEKNAQLASDNDFIHVAEHIICDEERARCRRKGLNTSLHLKGKPS
ncbi:unnamed protein product [Chrysoparadoxa australica]